MDRLESLSTQLSQITLYDIKSMYNQAKNVVLNVSEMEAKVREATNDEPWGASSTLMQDIAQGTFNFQNFNEIMPCIYARFMEKEASQWRQIYKALQLLEYLVKHGSERVVDDARSHISTIKMLRNFHYIDDKGKDEGINVRNRSRELVEMLADVEKIRTERRKAKANRHKYTGTGNDGLSFRSGGGQYGGFGSDSLGGGSYSGGGGSSFSGAADRDYGGYSGGGSSGFRDETRRGGFEEYNAGDDEAPVRRSASTSHHSGSSAPRRGNTVPAAPPPKPKEPEIDLLGGFGDDDAFTTSAPPPVAEKALPALDALTGADDDEFADFQAAPSSPPPATAAKPNLMAMLSSTPSPTTARPPTHAVSQSYSQPSYHAQPSVFASNTNTTAFGAFGGLSPTSSRQSFTSPVSAAATPNYGGRGPMTPASPPPRVGSTPATTAAKPSSNFDDLWSMSLGGSSTSANKSAGGSKSIKDLEKEKAQAGIWGAQQKPATMGSGFGSFGSGSFGGASGGASTSASSGGDDLLL